MQNILQELKRRKVFRAAAVYTVASWVIVQVADVLLPTFNAPLWVNQSIIIILILGFPIALVLAWLLDITPEGLEVTQAEDYQSKSDAISNRITGISLGLIAFAVAFLFVDRYFLDPLPQYTISNQVAPAVSESSLSKTFINLAQLQLREQGGYTSFDFTPDGRTAIYTSFSDNVYRLHRRNLDQLDSETLFESDEGIFLPKISPDGTRAIFYSTSRIWIIPVDGGAVQELVRYAVPNSYNWLDENSIVYTQNPDFTVNVISSTGEHLFSLDRGLRRNGIYIDPEPIPGTSIVLFSVSDGDWVIHAVNLETGESTPIIRDGFETQYMETGHIGFVRDNYLWAVPFDVNSLTITGRETPLVEGVQNVFNYGAAAYAISSQGQLIYILGESQIVDANYLRWIDEEGNSEFIDLPARDYREPTISPDGRFLAMTIVQPSRSSDIWVYEFETGLLNVITNMGGVMNPVWTPDSSQIVFNDLQSDLGFWIVNANGSEPPQQFTREDVLSGPGAFAPDGSKLVYVQGDVTDFDLRLLDLTGSQFSSSELLSTGFEERQPAISPDGNWIAYMSDETGQNEVYVRPFPNIIDDKIRVTTNGGVEPVWDQNGQYLYFIALDNELYRTPISTTGDFTFGEAELVTVLTKVEVNEPSYTISPIDKRILTFGEIEEEDDQSNLHSSQAIYVTNWFEEVKRSVPVSEIDSEQ